MIIKITDHVQQALNRLLFQYKESTNFRDFVTTVMGEQIQDIEDIGFELFGRLDIDNQEGEQLDGIGEIVGQPREGLTDDEYRVFLKARIAVNVSEGDAERLINTWKLLMDANTVELIENFPAEVSFYTDTSIGNPNLEALAFELIQLVAAGGVRVGFAAVYPDNAFGFADSGINTSGFGDDTDGNIGGEFSSIIGQ